MLDEVGVGWCRLVPVILVLLSVVVPMYHR